MKNAEAGKKVSVAAPRLDEELYAKRQKIYPREVHGLFANLRLTGVVVLMGIFYGVPWLNWDQHQAVLWDLPNRKFHIFSLTFWPQDLFYLAGLLIIAALSLFFFTALAGRLWCGYACPQTVWTEVFLWIERKIEGSRPKQMKLDKGGFSRQKFFKKATKHFLWITLSLWTGYTFVGYFSPIREMGIQLLELSLGPWQIFWILFYGFATYGNAGWLREQVCIYMCPYARFQSAMLDKDSLIISYDSGRGEPRGSRRRSDDAAAMGLGDCIDCTMCVQACPTGIDIREGLQYECIGCAACIDACDEVMDKVGYPRGLVRYTTENALDNKPTKILRTRVIVYGVVLLTLLSGVIASIAMRVPLELDVIRDRNVLFRETEEGHIENVYTLKLMNKDRLSQIYKLEIDADFPLELDLNNDQLQVDAGSVRELTVTVRAHPDALPSQSNSIEFVLTSANDPNISAVELAKLVGPTNND